MKGIQIWQHPYVDIFKYTGITEWRQCQKEGDVTETIDKTIGKKVYKLQGSISASNYIQIPKPKSDMKTLGLNGKFVYILLKVPPGKLFSLHLDLIVTNTRTNIEEPLKVSLSNLFKENKFQNSLQISCKASGRWSIVCMDFNKVLNEYFGEKMAYKELRMMTLCANMLIKGIYTSDILYNPKTLPKDISLKNVKVEDWNSLFDWVHIPEVIGNENYQIVEEPVLVEEKKVTFKKKYPIKDKKNTQRSLKDQEDLGTNKKVNEDVRDDKSRQEVQGDKVVQDQEYDKKISKKNHAVPKPLKDEKSLSKPSAKLQKPLEIPPKLNLNTNENPIEVNFNTMLPDPIITLSNILSFSSTPYSTLWAPAEIFASYPSPFKDGTSKFLFYISKCAIILLNPITLDKSFLFGHNSNIISIQLYKTYLVSSDISSNIFFWPLKSRKNPIPLSIKKLKEIVFFTFFLNKMIVSGKDELKRDLVLLYDTSNIVKKKEIIHLGQQISDFDIKVIKFYEENKLISIGKDSIRLWTYKEDRLVSCGLNNPLKDQYSYTDLDISAKKAYIGSIKGTILIINLITKELESTLAIHKGEITRIKLVEDIIMTSSADTYVRLWPSDFRELYMEIQHKSKVTSIDILGNTALTLTEIGVLGIIDLQNASYSTLLRSYINTQSYCISSKYVSVISSYITVLTFDLQLIYEFCSPNDDALVTCIHPLNQIIACGFYSGAVRLFDLGSMKVIDEHLQHKASIEVLKFSYNGAYMLSISEDGLYSIYSIKKEIQPVKDGKIDVPCNIVAAFSRDSAYLAFITNYGGSIAVISTDPLTQKFKINSSNNYIHIDFSDKYLLSLTQNPSKMIYYLILESKISVIKEIDMAYNIHKFVISPNSKYIVAADQDFTLKVFDLFFTMPCQSFLGHSGSINEMFWERDSVFSFSVEDGVYVWNFKGSLAVDDASSDSKETLEIQEISEESEEPLEIDMEKEVEEYLRHVEQIQTNMLVPTKPSLKYMFGYTPIKNNLFWSREKSCLIYSLGSMVVKTLLVGEKKQVLLQGHYNTITALAVSPNQSYIATGEGLANIESLAKINIWNMDTGKIWKVLEYHDKVISCLNFSPCSEYLCSIGNINECILVIWELITGRPVSTSILASHPTSIKWLPFISTLEFTTLSSTELIFWRLNSLKHLEFQPGDTIKDNMTCMDFSSYFEDISSNLLVVGSSTGNVSVYNTRTNTIVFNKKLFDWEITNISCQGDYVILGGLCAEITIWKWSDGIFAGHGVKVLCDGYPVSMHFNNAEGIVGTHLGSIWYMDIENGNVRILSSHYKEIISICTNEFIATSSDDNTIRIWNPTTLEQKTHIMAATSKCKCLAFHKHLPYLVGGFEDGTLKAFEIESNRCLGSTRSSLNPVVCLCFSTDSDGILLGTDTGVLIAVIILKWSPFTVDFIEFASLPNPVLSIDIKNKLVSASTDDGVIQIWEKKYTGETLSHTKLFQNTQIDFNLIDIFDFKEPHERIKHIYSQNDSLECKSKFDPITDKNVWIVIKGAQYLLYRNFASHQVTRKINLSGFPLCLSVSSHKVAVGLSDRRILVYYDGSIHEYLSHSEPVVDLSFLKNGLATIAGLEIAIWEF